MRNEIAKIIDPDAWERWGKERGGIGFACFAYEAQRTAAFAKADEIIAPSLAMADAILALRSQAGSALQVHPSELMGEIGRLQAEIAALRSPPMNQEALWVCTGCGTRKSMEQIKGEQPQALSCCPERRMMPVERKDA